MQRENKFSYCLQDNLGSKPHKIFVWICADLENILNIWVLKKLC